MIQVIITQCKFISKTVYQINTYYKRKTQFILYHIPTSMAQLSASIVVSLARVSLTLASADCEKRISAELK